MLLMLVLAVCLFVSLNAQEKEQHPSNLESGFLNPPPQARPHIWWHWMNGNITKEGITADLEAMHRVGFGGVYIFNIAGPRMSTDIPSGPIDYLSKEWLDLVKYSVSEAERLGIEVGIHNCAGWATTGGPWIKPEHGMQMLVSSEDFIRGNQHIKKILPHPEIRENYYRDIAVYALPHEVETGYRVPKWQQKAGQRGGPNDRQPEFIYDTEGAAIPISSIIDLTGKVSEEGVLIWDAPPGGWKIIRLGHTSTSRVNAPAPKAGEGLEIDKLRREGLDVHWENGIEPILKHLGPLVGKSFNNILVDSYEAGLHHWTPRMREEFKKRRGYDPGPYLLTLTGRLLGDVPTTERFLWDFRRTIADLFAENYYGYFAELSHKHGLLFSNEPYTSCFEGMQVGANADIPTGEFWANGGYSFSLRLAASLAHINDRTFAGAEAFTGGPGMGEGQWQSHPGSLKKVGDWAWTQGINHFIFHSYPHQPWNDIFPGMTLGQYGCHFDRHNTWWEPGRAWIQYIHRSQFLLQSGTNVADVLCFAGDAAPNGGVHRDDIKNSGYDYDACGTDILAELKVEDGDIVLPTGKKYRILVMPDHGFLRPEFARKVRDLVREGATIVGPKPKHTPSLEGFPSSEEEVVAIGEEVWGLCDGTEVKSNKYGKGQVYSGVSPAEVLDGLNVVPAVRIREGSAELTWIQRKTEEADIFFISNQSGRRVNTVAGFRTVGKKPEFWDAVNASIETVSGWTVKGEHTQVPLSLNPDESVFVIFRHSGKPDRDPYVEVENPLLNKSDTLWMPDFITENKLQLRTFNNGSHILQHASGKTKNIEVEKIPEPLNLEGPWKVKFQPERGAPAEAWFDTLISWDKHPDSGIRYFSGTATYNLDFDVSQDYLNENQEVWIDLGEIAVIAEVRLNGKDLGVLWNKPFRLEISKTLSPGTNTLEIDVTNLWVNRLIGDEQYPEDFERIEGKYLNKWPDWLNDVQQRPETSRVTFTSWKHWNKDDELLPSGLIGPVILRCAKLTPIN